MSVGNLHLKLVEAHLTHDVKKLGRMDPYCKIVCRDFHWKSNADKNGSKKPVWHDQEFDIDVKYMGDDIYYKLFDEDHGKDEKIGDGGCKISTFCAEPEMDMWMDIEYKGKKAGKVRFESKWSPAEEPKKEEHEGMMAEAQAALIALAKKKKELEEEFESVNATIAEHEASHEGRLAAVAGDYDMSAFEEAKAQAWATYHEKEAQINKERDMAQEAKQDAEAAMAQRVREAAEARDAKDKEIAELEVKAAADKEQALADIEAGKIAAAEGHEHKVQAVKDEVAAQAAEDEAAYESVAGEIKVIAERLLELNEKMQEKLTALTNL